MHYVDWTQNGEQILSALIFKSKYIYVFCLRMRRDKISEDLDMSKLCFIFEDEMFSYFNETVLDFRDICKQ